MIPEIDGTQFTLSELAVELRKRSSRTRTLPVALRVGKDRLVVRCDNFRIVALAFLLASEIVQIRKDRWDD